MNNYKMRVIALIGALALFSSSFTTLAQDGGSSGAEVLTNEKVVTMTRAGLSSSIIISKIRSSKTNFNVSTDELIRLKQSRVPDDIINAMVEASSSASYSTSRTVVGDATRTDPNDPMSPHEPGIYMLEKSALIEMNPTVFQGTKANFWGTALTYGLKKTKMRAVARGASANTVTSSSKPEFYFYFDRSLSNPGYAMAGFLAFGASSPAEFTMVKMEQKKNTREAVLGEFNAYTSSTGARDKDIVEFSFEKIRPGVFKVTPRGDLPPGEYCFYFAGTPQGLGFAGGKIFDFSVAKAL